MTGIFEVKKPIYPIFSVASSFLIFVGALVFAHGEWGAFFLLLMYILLLFFGYAKTCLKILPFSLLYSAFFALIFYFAGGKNLNFALQMAVRLMAIFVAAIPGLSLPPALFVRNLTQVKCPRLVTLGMLITLTFIPVLAAEIRQIRNAMKTRGATSLWKPAVLYRAFLIPLVVRIVNISDTLTLSVETRGFVSDENAPSVYKPVVFTVRDALFAVFFVLIFAICIFLSVFVKIGGQ